MTQDNSLLAVLRLLGQLTGADAGNAAGQSFDPYQQPGMGMGYGPTMGAGAASGPPPDMSGYGGPSRFVPPPAPAPGMLQGGNAGGYGLARGANSMNPAIIRMLLEGNR